MNRGVQMLMKLGAFALRVGQGRAVDERTRAEMRGVNGVMNLELTGPDGGGWHVAFDEIVVAPAAALGGGRAAPSVAA